MSNNIPNKWKTSRKNRRNARNDDKKHLTAENPSPVQQKSKDIRTVEAVKASDCCSAPTHTQLTRDVSDDKLQSSLAVAKMRVTSDLCPGVMC